MIGAIVDTSTLGKVVLYSLLAGVGIVVVFGLGVSSVAAVLESLRSRRTLASAMWGGLATVCLALVLAAVTVGVIVMTSKS